MLALSLLATATAAAEPETLTGTVSVIAGNTFVIGETVIRLADIDAPELAQMCDGGPALLRSCGEYRISGCRAAIPREVVMPGLQRSVATGVAEVPSL